MTELYIMEVMEQTMADGPGLRTSIYCAGCRHHCPGCHNPQSWKFENGHKMSVNDLLQIIKDDDLSNVSFSGGDPFYQVEGFTELARRIKEETDKTIWCWTGFTYEEILADSRLSMLLPYIDVLVDGPYVESLRDPQLDMSLFRFGMVIDYDIPEKTKRYETKYNGIDSQKLAYSSGSIDIDNNSLGPDKGRKGGERRRIADRRGAGV